MEKNIKQPSNEDTLTYIFKLNEKEVFMNEMHNLVEEIENAGIEHCKIYILINFILYKLSELENHKKIAQTILSEAKVRSNSFIRKFCSRQTFAETKNAMVDVLLDSLVKLDGISLEFLKKTISQNNSESNLTNSQEKLLRKLEEKLKEKQAAREKAVLSTSKMANSAKCDNMNANNIYNKNQNTLYNSNFFDDEYEFISENYDKDEDENENENETISISPKRNIINNINLNALDSVSSFFNYKLKIFYLNGSDSYFQLINIKSKANLDYNAFIFRLKKKLGIYENSKFNIILMADKREIEFFTDMRQLKMNETTELKIVPIHYLINYGNAN